jgi:hypothetical protein
MTGILLWPSRRAKSQAAASAIAFDLMCARPESRCRRPPALKRVVFGFPIIAGVAEHPFHGLAPPPEPVARVVARD